MYKIILLLLIFMTHSAYSQTDISNYGRLLRFEMENSPFPDEERANGHTYKDKLYSFSEHYNDSTTLVFIPDYFNPEGEADIVFYFHGWKNNIDSMIVKFDLIRQFSESGINALLIMPEGPKNSPDSFGGKFEEKDVFSNFIIEVIEKTNTLLGSNISSGDITLSGHSGAYRVMAYILLRGGQTQNIRKVIIFDGLYADIEKYSYWLDHYNGKFINIYSQNGGTKRESENLMECLSSWDIPYVHVVEDNLSDTILNENRIIFIESSLSHGGVIHERNQFKKFLKAK